MLRVCSEGRALCKCGGKLRRMVRRGMEVVRVVLQAVQTLSREESEQPGPDDVKIGESSLVRKKILLD